MSFESIDYAQKRVRLSGSKEWKLWYTEEAAGLQFRMLIKDSDGDCYETIKGFADRMMDEDLAVQEDDNQDGYFSERYRFEEETGSLEIFLEVKTEELVWVSADGDLAKADCTLQPNGPLMPEIAG
jgi:hypothetical protein